MKNLICIPLFLIALTSKGQKLEIEPEAYAIVGQEMVPKYVADVFLTLPFHEGSLLAINFHMYSYYDTALWNMIVFGLSVNREKFKIGVYGGYETTPNYLRGGIWFWWQATKRIVAAGTYENGASGPWFKAEAWYQLSAKKKKLMPSVGFLTEEFKIGPALMLAGNRIGIYGLPAVNTVNGKFAGIIGVRFLNLSHKFGKK